MQGHRVYLEIYCRRTLTESKLQVYKAESGRNLNCIFNKLIWFILIWLQSKEAKSWRLPTLLTVSLSWLFVRLNEHVTVPQTRLVQMTGNVMRSGSSSSIEPHQLIRTRIAAVHHVAGWMEHFWWPTTKLSNHGQPSSEQLSRWEQSTDEKGGRSRDWENCTIDFITCTPHLTNLN
jgi:hypothetical protein